MKVIYQSLLLILIFALIFLWQQSGSSTYTIQAIALLVLTYVGMAVYRRKRKKQDKAFNTYIDILILNCVILLLILATNGLSSPLFFLLYFLAFGITFVFEPITVFLFIIGAVILFLPEALTNNAMGNYIKLGSLVLICPLAYYFGISYKERTEKEERIEEMVERSHEAAETISKDISEIIDNEKESIKAQDVEKFNEILEETEDLRAENKEE